MKIDNLLTMKGVFIHKGVKLPDVTLSSGDVLWIQTENNLQADLFTSFMLGLFEPKVGKAVLAGTDIRDAKGTVSYIDISRWNPRIDSVETFIKLLAYDGGFQISSVINEFRKILDGMDSGYILNMSFEEMSVSTKNIISTAISLSMPKLIIILLEPFAGLDKKAISFIGGEIKKIVLDGSSFIILSDSEPPVYSKHVKMEPIS
ncbi:MAG: hypothetical protein NTY22_00485 [Proteobacteria bacterium]|nr:hypothetical protein [Pseudomonadota bacterium]